MNIGVCNEVDTINYLINKRCSIARYGDGEFGLIKGRNLGFQ